MRRITAAVVAAVMMWLCTGRAFPAKAQGTAKCVVKGTALTISDDISVDFYVDAQSTNGVQRFELQGPEGSVTLSVSSLKQITQGSRSGLYKLSYTLPAGQADELITLKAVGENGSCELYRPDGSTRYDGDKASSSIRGYIKKVKADSSADKELKELADALEAYADSSEYQYGAKERFESAKINYRLHLSNDTPTESVKLNDTDGSGTKYTFTYQGQTFTAEFTVNPGDKKENWRIYDSYLIRSRADMVMICSELIKLHGVHGRDMVSWRTAEDMADEWQIHNTAYDFLPDGNKREHAKDVDFDPDDQGKSFWDFVKESLNGE